MNKYILIFLSFITIAFAKNRCLTPNKEIGICIPINKCPTLKKNVHEKVKEHELFLKESLCQKGLGKQINVCCGTYSIYKKNHPKSQKYFENPKLKKPATTKRTTTTPRPVLKKPETIWKDPKTHQNFKLLPSICGHAKITADRIFGGKEAEIKEFPWMALLEYRKNGKSTKYGCAGSLINNRYILTAAHCIVGDIKQDSGDLFRIRLGEHDTRLNQDCLKKFKNNDFNICYDEPQDVFVEKIIVHPKYSVSNNDKHYDIALVRLKYPVQASETIRPVCLPINGETSKPGYKLTVAGWGYTEKGIPSPIKLKAEVPYIADNKCREIWRKISFDVSYRIINSQFCAGGEKGIDSCQKDSGGPIMATFPGSTTWYQEGIVSFGSFCGDKTPAIYTRVSSFLIWILDNLKP